MQPDTRVTAIVPTSDFAASQAFYARLGFRDVSAHPYPDYRILADGKGGHLHLTRAPAGWVEPERNPFGIYIYSPHVEALAEAVRELIIEREKAPTHKPWGIYEFSVSDPDGTLVRIGWPSDQLER